jgi:hypothetical protein
VEATHGYNQFLKPLEISGLYQYLKDTKMKRILTILFLISSFAAFSQAPDTLAWMSKRQILKLGLRGGSVDTFMLKFHGTSGLGTPIGNTTQRPFVPSGWIVFRYNTDSLAMEFGNDSQQWFKMAGGGAAGITTLAALTDVAISSPADGHMLVYRTSNSKWNNEAVSLANAFVNGLNAFGANSTIGNSDNFSLSIRTNNAARINISNAGAVSLPDGSLTVGGTTNGVINIQSSAASTRGSIDLSSNNPRNNSATGSWLFGNAGATIGRYDSDKWFFGGGSVNTVATIGIIAGTTSISPMQFNSGPLKTSKCVGCWGFLTDKLYFTITTGTAEKEVALWDAAGTSGRVPFATTNNRLLDDGGFLWNNTTKVLSVQSGTTSAMAKVGGPIWNSAANNLTSTTSETDLYSFTTPATTLGADGDWLEYEVDGVINPDAVGGGATKTIRIYWAGTEVSEMTSTSTTAQYFKALVRVVRTTSSNARVMVSVLSGAIVFDGTNPAIMNVTTTFSNTNVLKITGQTTSATDIVAVHYGTIKYWPQSL